MTQPTIIEVEVEDVLFKSLRTYISFSGGAFELISNDLLLPNFKLN